MSLRTDYGEGDDDPAGALDTTNGVVNDHEARVTALEVALAPLTSSTLQADVDGLKSTVTALQAAIAAGLATYA